jgi:hypothetical protein
MERGASFRLLAVVAAAGAVLGGCQRTSAQLGIPERAGYTCCNLHHEGDWISDGNYAELPMIAAGAPARVKSYGRNHALVDVNGRPMRLGHDYGREQESLQQFVNKIVVTSDPKAKLATWPAATQDAIRQGKVMVGMTKEQVIMALGYPMTSENPSLDADLWRYWASSFGPYQILWDDRGRVREIAGDQLVTNLVVYRPRSG